MRGRIEWTLPLKTISVANVSEHWSVKHRRQKINEKIIWAQWKKEKPTITLPCEVMMTRIATRELDEEDNLRMALKHVKDVIADKLVPGMAPGQADGNKKITWLYGQEKGKIRSVKIKITW